MAIAEGTDSVDAEIYSRAKLAPDNSEMMFKKMKTFRKAPHEIKSVVAGIGSCFASDRIPVDGMKVGYMYRKSPDDAIDSGWRFFAGDESREYADNPSHFAIYDVNTIANYDPTIVELLEKSAPCAFEWDASLERWISITPPEDEDQ